VGVFLTFTDKIKNSLPILWLLESNLPPLTFISNGERVPEDLLKAEEDVLIKLFLRGFE
jgi:flagellar biosynthesis protein FlhF